LPWSISRSLRAPLSGRPLTSVHSANERRASFVQEAAR
jgi:hypothetical protein